MIAITRIMQRSRHFWSYVSKWKTWNTDERNPWKKNAKNYHRLIHSWRLLGIALFQAWNDLRNCQRSFTSSSMLCSTATSLALSTDLSCSRSWITFLMPLLKGIQIHMVKSKYGILKMILCMFSWKIEYQNRIGYLQNLIIYPWPIPLRNGSLDGTCLFRSQSSLSAIGQSLPIGKFKRV